MTLQEKIIELLPEEKEKPQGIQNAGTILPIFGYNQALQDVKEKLPEILKLIREEVEKLYQDEHPVDCIDGETPVETYGYEATHNQALKQVLELLK